MENLTIKKKESEKVKGKNISEEEETKNSSPVCYADDDEVQPDYKTAVEKDGLPKGK
ncbi:hypothetical protein [Reichenbachiella sp. MALMAid0571]|uniref:hypothetical protein n=1 Tax=Reichenbachiella sp. MALMAid0571 TaxID=3143939 RepID=UPI0032DF82F6